jgi:hypothetical protein
MRDEAPEMKPDSFRFAFLLALAALVAGCAGETRAQPLSPANAAKYRSAVILENSQSTIVGYHVIPIPGSVIMTDGDKSKGKALGDTAEHIKRALARHGIQSLVATTPAVPAGVDLVVVYQDEWQWDMKMYMKYLKIDVFDARTKVLVGTGSYTAGGGGFHDYPTAEREAPNIIDAIFLGR